MKNFFARTITILHSRRFFWFTLGFFVLESAWIALSAVYPQAFDESFHFGLIKTYAHYWLPFLGSQPPGADPYGAMFRDPSYLYHYSMSFPYRLIALAIHGQTTQVIVMRLLNIILASCGLVLFRKVLLRAKLSPALTNVSLFIFVLIPIVPQLAGQINYDNLLFPLVAWTCLLAMQVADEFVAKRPSVRTICTLAAVCLLASLVKYEFLPIAVGVLAFLVYLVVKNFRKSWPKLLTKIMQSWHEQSWLMRAILTVIVIISAGMFVQRDGINVIKYHAIEPDCGAVLNLRSCEAYSPWAATHGWHQDVKKREAAGKPLKFVNPLAYTAMWFYWLWYRLFFAVNGPASGFRNYPPLILPAAAAIILSLLGLVAMAVRGHVLNNPYMIFFGLTIVAYLVALWISGYLQYRYTHVPVLMNGRYLLPIVLPVAIVIGRPIAALLRNVASVKASLAVLTLLLFLQGGGVLTFIMRSDAEWDWPNRAVVKANNTARSVLWPVILTGKRTYDTSFWFFN